MLDVLEKYLNTPSGEGCAVNVWLQNQPQEVQEIFVKLQENRSLNMSALYNDLANELPLPFKISVFRMHMRGYCSCKK